ncbi:Allophanate hydrolase subunit 2 [Vibrio sp. B1ASS3]|uniref:urea carboxylase n=1 Tax=Vibrio sp. B1ASS3 TaxID=2751176 RepID=UPI001ABA197A|nr:urea carboxylase [Vibrio sp. B1ASS3]CAD7821127.1 Allophanate hydrolase subunit 2 [Vibrio sp. B1ASS3]CAE6943946.1 Allophanate hydrolase subunit 2 [Vibrio sp. B1ASS3]
MFSKVLIANRGAIACRVIRTLKQLNIGSVAVYSEADAQSLHVVDADQAFSLGKGGASETYLDQEKIISIAKQAGAEAIHPGYGFLSENPEFVERCEQEGLVFLGPTAEQMRAFGLKHSARRIATQAKVPLLPGTELLSDKQQALIAAEQIGYPVMLKSTAGGGGIGMQCCFSSDELTEAFDSVKRLSANNFSSDGVFVEKFIQQARHIEVQIFGDGRGHVVALGERDCSAQRRNQKVIEETPAPNLSESIRTELQNTAIRLASKVNYRNAGTVEFVLDQQTQAFYFLEVNTRLQVEHGVTEEVFDVDLVEWMIRQGAEAFDLEKAGTNLESKGHAIQVRLYAEDANKNFQPCAGLLSHVNWAKQDNLRIEHWIEAGVEVSPFFDPMLAKVIVHAKDRETALAELKRGLDNSVVYGIEHNQAYLSQLLDSELVKKGEVLTQSLNSFEFQPHTFDVLSGGTQTTIQDYPARTGYWDIGVPPSGPMDSLNFRLANCLVGNLESAAGLEIIVSGPTLRFNQATFIALTGAKIEASLDGQQIEMKTRVKVEAGQVLKLGKVLDGARTYLAVHGGIDCPEYLGSRSTFTLGQFGGHAGRALVAGDVLHINREVSQAEPKLDAITQTEFDGEWQIRVIYGPHGAPDYFTQQDIDSFFDAEWKVHFNSSRTGVRLIGPKPNWARSDGGEAGLHPSNIHDNAYAVGTIDFTGDMPVILGPDGPSLGGFVCPATIIKADLWKMGQLKAGDKIRFIPVLVEDAEHAERVQLAQIETGVISELALQKVEPISPVIKTIPADRYGEEVIYRPSGEDYLLVEYGPQVLDIRLRFRVHALMIKLQQKQIVGVEELTPGIRSLQIHYDNLVLPREQLLAELEAIEAGLDNIDQLLVPARIVHLPLSWDDEATRLAIRKYDEVVRKDAPWCPDNIEFIRRINGLDSVEDVKKIVFDASYLVMGLGDVYLGAPVATPMDPRHRLVTTKYNPARTWTPENAVGIGGAYMCVYGMEGPGGYQFVGRTLQMWNRYRLTEAFTKPWLLRFFDQIKFYEVSAEELLDIREKHPQGHYPVKIEQTEFSLSDYQAFLDEHADEINVSKTRQQKAFEEERQRWEESGQANFVATEIEQSSVKTELAEGQEAIESHVAGNIWQVLVEPGQIVKENEVVMILEAMKMELEVTASVSGVVDSICHDAGAQVHAGEPLLVVNTCAA